MRNLEWRKGYGRLVGAVGVLLLSVVAAPVVAGTLAAESIADYGGHYPYKMLALDLDGDGSQDLVILDHESLTPNTAIRYPAQFKVLLNDGAGNFSTVQTHDLQTYARTTSLTSGDYNNDNRPDIAVSSEYLSDINGTWNAQVEIFFGDGSGGFAAGTTLYESATQPSYNILSLASGDWNGDGIDDLAALAGQGGNGLLTILKSNGDGSFTASELALTVGDGRLAALDWDKDGDQDLFLVKGNSTQAVAYLNDGTGQFSPMNYLLNGLYFGKTRSHIGDVAVADLDGDGTRDIVFSSYQYDYTFNSTSGESGVLWGDAGGGFTAQTMFRGGAEQMAFMDVDGDGRLDIVMSRSAAYWLQGSVLDNDRSSGVTYFINQGNRSFSSHYRPSGAASAALAAADFDGDGLVTELALANYGPQAGLTIINPVTLAGLGYLRADSSSGTAHRSYADMDNDGVLDSITISNAGSGTNGVDIYGGDGSGGFGTDPSAYHGVWSANLVEVVALDIDQDGYRDLFGRDASGYLFAALNPLGTGFTPWGHSSNAVSLANSLGSTFASSLAVGDITGDGIPDVVMAGKKGSTYVYNAVLYAYDVQAGGGGLSAARMLYSSPVNGGRYLELRLADMDGDGDLDLVTSGRDDVSLNVDREFLFWLANDGAGNFTAPSTSSLLTNIYRLVDFALADVNNDGLEDVVVITESSTTPNVDVGLYRIRILIQGTSGFVEQIVNHYPTEYGARQLSLGDVDGDGNVDLVIAQTGSDRQANRPNGVVIRYGDGAGGFARLEFYAVETNTSIVEVGRLLRLVDLNNDGQLELSQSNRLGTTILAKPGSLGGDTTAPVILPPPAITVDAVTGNGIQASATAIVNFLNGVSATDNIAVTSLTHDAPAVFPLGTTVVTFTAGDAAGNTATATSTVTVVDRTPPVVTPPADITVEATGATTAVSLGTALVTDNVDQGLSAAPDASGPFGLGTHVVVWRATDSAGNTGSATQSVTVRDTTPPTITLAGDDPMTLSVGDTFNDPGASATDGVDGAVAVTVSGQVDTTTVGEYTLTYSASDKSGNTAQASRLVRVTAAADNGSAAAPVTDVADTPRHHGGGAFASGLLLVPFALRRRARRRRPA